MGRMGFYAIVQEIVYFDKMHENFQVIGRLNEINCSVSMNDVRFPVWYGAYGSVPAYRLIALDLDDGH